MSTKPLVSIVVLNWNGLADTRECLASLRKLTYKNKEIIIVDNGSTDGSKEFLSDQNDIVFVNLDKNYGFTGGHIRGFEVAKGNYVAIINNDLVLDKNWIDETLKTFQAHNKAAIVGGKSYKWDDDNPAYDTSNSFTSWQKVDPRTGYTRTLLVGDEECTVDSISGAALMIDKEAINQVGYFDDDFFAYYEETDLIARLLRAGYEAYYNPRAVAWHKVAGSSEGGAESYFYLYMMHRNRYLFAVKNLDDAYMRMFLSNYYREFLRALVGRVLRPNDEKRARVNAYIWNSRHREQTFAKRADVMQLGDSYVTHLGRNQPKDVTIVIPCYNYGQFVEEAIDSALAQTLLPKKIIVINDGSTDDSKEILKKYQGHELVEVINKDNTGVIDTKNLGMHKSETYWTVFFDADDVLEAEFIEKTVQKAIETDSDVIYTDMELFGAVEAVFHAGDYRLPRLIRRNFIHNSALISTSLLKQVGGYKPIMKDGLEDWELYLTLAEHGAHFGYLPETVFRYRQHDSSMSRNSGVLKKEKELYNLLLSLHPGLRRYTSRTRRWLVALYKGLRNIVQHPSLLLVILRALPRAGIAFIRSILHDVRLHKGKVLDDTHRNIR